MSDLLVDASVAVKWLIHEEHSEQAVLLLREARAMRWRFICPPHFVSEVFNVVYRRMQRGDPSLRLTADQAADAIEDFLLYPFEAIRAEELYRHAWFVAHCYKISTIYDALYVALADLHSTPVWTADKRLVSTVSDTNLVRWIGEYEG